MRVVVVKVGRNEPCPCGSGRKYKKCCLPADEARAREAALAATEEDSNVCPECGSPLHEPVEGIVAKRLDLDPDLSPYSLAKIAEDPRIRESIRDSHLRREVEEGLRRRWTIAKAAALATEEIEDTLRGFGVLYSREGFLDLAVGRSSAWSISEVWRASPDVTVDADGADFLGFAACELWKRLRPDRPSTEMSDDWMQDGYGLLEEKKEPEACDIWWRVWQVMRPRFTERMRRMDDAREVFSGVQSIFNWCPDFEMSLGNASRRDPRYARIGRQYCEEWIAQFPDEDEWAQVSFRRALAGFLALLGEAHEAEDILLGIVEEWPRNVWGYVALADASAPFFCDDSTSSADPAQAREWLRKGLAAVSTDDEDREVLEERLREIEKRES